MFNKKIVKQFKSERLAMLGEPFCLKCSFTSETECGMEDGIYDVADEV